MDHLSEWVIQVNGVIWVNGLFEQMHHSSEWLIQVNVLFKWMSHVNGTFMNGSFKWLGHLSEWVIQVNKSYVNNLFTWMIHSLE